MSGERKFDGAAAGMEDGYISLEDFCRLSGLEVSASEHNCRFEYCTAPAGQCPNPE